MHSFLAVINVALLAASQSTPQTPVIITTDSRCEVSIDGELVARLEVDAVHKATLAPGQHLVSAACDGDKRWKKVVSVAREQLIIAIELAPGPTPQQATNDSRSSGSSGGKGITGEFKGYVEGSGGDATLVLEQSGDAVRGTFAFQVPLFSASTLSEWKSLPTRWAGSLEGRVEGSKLVANLVVPGAKCASSLTATIDGDTVSGKATPGDGCAMTVEMMEKLSHEFVVARSGSEAQQRLAAKRPKPELAGLGLPSLAMGKAEVCHDRGTGWENCCAGELTWSQNEIRFKNSFFPGGSLCFEDFKIPTADIVEIEQNKLMGLDRGAFHIKAGRQNYNFAPIDFAGRPAPYSTGALLIRLKAGTAKVKQPSMP